MEMLQFRDVENSLLPFRTGRRLIFDRILELAATSGEIQESALFLTRLFVRIKSADSILEKIRRKKLPVHQPGDIPTFMDDILGFRLIVENQSELQFIDDFLTRSFMVKSIAHHPQTEQFGGQSIEYSLIHEQDDKKYPFEVQLRTFLQHYWAGHSFFLFHKKNMDSALPHQNDLLALSNALQTAEKLAEKIRTGGKEVRMADAAAPNWQSWPIRTRVHLMAVRPHEQFVDERIIQLTGIDEEDHRMIVQAKMACYEKYSNAVIVECMCANFASFLLNEPQVHVASEYLEKAVW